MEDKVLKLYNAFVSDGYEMEPIESFRENLKVAQRRKAAYDALVSEGYEMEPFEEFERNIGFGLREGDASALPSDNGSMQSVSGGDRVAGATTVDAGNGDVQAASAGDVQGAPVVAADNGWSVSERIRGAERLRAANDVYGARVRGIGESVGRMARPVDERMSDDRRNKFRARMAGADTNLVGISGAVRGDDGAVSDGAGGGVNVTVSPQVDGYEYDENGKPVARWRLSDGSVTTDRVLAEREEGVAQQGRLSHEFERKMRRYNLDMSKPEDVERMRNIETAERIIAELEERKRGVAKELRGLLVERERSRQANESQGLLEMLGSTANAANAGMHPTPTGRNAGIADTNDREKTLTASILAIDKEIKRLKAGIESKDRGWLGNLISGVADGLTDPNTWTLGMVDMSIGSERRGARSATGSAAQQRLAETMELGEYGSSLVPASAWYEGGHFAGSIMGDPVAMASAGVGSAARAGVSRLLGAGMTDAVASRWGLRSLSTRLLTKSAETGANFGAYEMLGDLREQMNAGGYYDENGEFHEGFSLSELMGRGVHGVGLGLASGMTGTLWGNLGDKVVRSVDSVAAKGAARGMQHIVSPVLEGTVFAAAQYIESGGEMDLWDSLVDNVKFVAGMKAGGRGAAALRHSGETVRGVSSYLRDMAAESAAGGKSFMKVLGERLERTPYDMMLTDDEFGLLDECGYGDVSRLFVADKGDVQGAERATSAETSGRRTVLNERDGVYQTGKSEYVREVEGLDGFSRMEAVMRDGRVPQSVRAKLYWILTGRTLPQGTIMGYSKEVDDEGRVIVTTNTSDSEVVTRRLYDDEESAADDIRGIERQIEMNSIDVGEKFAQSQAETLLYESVAVDVAMEVGLPAEAVMNIIAGGRGGRGLSDAERRVYGMCVEEIDARRDEFERFTPAAIRDDVSSEISVDKVLSKRAQERTAQEQAVLDEYADRLYNDVVRWRKANDMFDEEMYRAAQEYREARGRAYRMYKEGRMLYGRYEDERGDGDGGAVSDVEGAIGRYRAAVEDCEGCFDEAEMYELERDAWKFIDDVNESEERREVALEYVNARAMAEGIEDARQESLERRRNDIRYDITRRTHRDSGRVIRGRTYEGEGDVYVIKGDVVMYGDGSGVDVRNSSESIIVMDADSGEYRMISPDRISMIYDGVAPEVLYDAEVAAMEREQLPDVVEPLAEDMPAGDDIIDRGGDESDVSSLSDQDNDGVNRRDTLTDEYSGQPETSEYEQQRRAMEAQSVPKNAESVPNPTENSVVEGENEHIAVSNDETALSRILRGGEALKRLPLNEQGEPMFEAVDRDTAWDGLVEVAGAEADAAEIAMAQVQQATADLEALKKKPPTPKVPKLKGSPMAMVQAKREADKKYQSDVAEYNQQLADAQARLDAWNGIVGVYTSRSAELRRQQEELRRQRDAEAHDAAVAQFEEQQRIRAEKKAEAERLGTHNVSPKIKEKWDNAPKIEGNSDALTLPDGSIVRGRYVLTEAGAASASHDINTGYEPTEGFPVDENGQSVNDRDYLRDKDAQRMVEQMAGAYDNRALQNPVIVSRDGVVLSGNNRTMSGDLAARQGTDKAYVDYLREFGGKYGFTSEQVGGMNSPRLVFVPDEALPYDATTFSRFNAQEMKSQSKPEAAVKLGKIVDDDVFNAIVSDISRYDRMSDYYADDKAVARALGALMQAGVINDKQMPEMRTGTALSAAGRELIENTLIGKVFQTSPDAVRQIISVPTLRQSVVMGLNEIAENMRLGQLKGAGNRTLAGSEYDLSEELSRAVDLVVRAKTAMPDVYSDGVPVSSFGRQQGLFDDEYGDSRVSDATTLLLADILNSGRPSELRKVLASYNNEAVRSAGGQGDIFTGEVPTKENILTEINEHYRNATQREQQALVDAAIAERKRRAEAEAERRGRDQGREQVENVVERGETNTGAGARGGNIRPTYERPKGEVDEYGIPFVVADDNGSTTFGEITEDSGLTPGPIKLSEGFQDEVTGKGYGLLHMEANHGEQIRQAGFNSVIEFVNFVSKNYDIDNIRVGKRRDDGRATFLIQVTDRHENTLFIELSKDSSYWKVNSGGVFRRGYSHKKETVAKTEPQQPNNAVSGDSSLSADKQGGTSSTEPNGESTVSFDKGKDNFVNSQTVEPTDAQKEAGNYKMEHRRIDGYNISIENPKGSIRRVKDADGKEWQSEMHHDYGYIRGTEGVDGDHIDVFLSDTPEEGDVFVVDQYNPDGSFDEHKVMYGFTGEEDAMQAYLSNYDAGWENTRRLDITGVSKDEFKKWVQSSKRKTKPFAEYAGVKSQSEQKQFDRTAPATPEAQRSAIGRIVDLAKRVKDRVERAVIGGITKRQIQDLAAQGIEIDDTWVHSFESSAVSHNQKHHGNAKAEESRGQIAVTEDDYNRIPEILETYDKVSKSPNTTNRTDNEVIIYEKEYDDGYVYYLEEKRDNRKSLAFQTMYKKKKGTDSSDGLMHDASTSTPLATPDNLSSNSVGKDNTFFANNQISEEQSALKGDNSAEKQADVEETPLTAEELREAVTSKDSNAPAKTSRPKKAPINRVSLEDVMTDLSTKGESQLSDHAEPVKAEQEVQHEISHGAISASPQHSSDKPDSAFGSHEISDDEMQSLANELRDLLGIGEDEGDAGIKFRDPGELTPQERQRIQSAGIRLAMGLVERGTASFPDYATKMVGLLGDKIRPWLKSFYEGARWTPGYENIAFTPSEEVTRFDVQNFDKVQANPIEQAAMIVEERKASTASAQAQKELTEIRNNKRKKQDEQTSADTAALTSKAEAIARKAESLCRSKAAGRLLAETSEDTAELNRVGEEIDQTIEEINDQLALLGYYEAVEDDAKFSAGAERQAGYHESYGYMLTAEKKAVADATKLAKQLVNDLGIDIKVTSATTPLGRKSVKKGTAVRANLAPAGGEVMINLPLNEGRQLAIYIGLEPVAEKGTRRRGDNLAVVRILYRVENPNGKGMERYGHNMYAPVESTYSDFLRRIKEITRDYLPEQKHPAEDIFAQAERIALQARGKSGIKGEPEGNSDFGPVFTQFKGDVEGAIRKLTELQTGEAIGALHHRDIGDIDLVWGKSGTGKSDGFGLAKLIKYHPEVVSHLQEIVDDMHIVKRSENRINLESDAHKAAVRLTWNKEKKKWLLTVFEKKETSESIDKTTDTDDNPLDLRGDTALSQNSDVSASKDSKKNFKAITNKKKTEILKADDPIGGLFANLFEEPETPISDEKKTDVQSRPGTAERERGHEPRQNEPLGESQRNEVKTTDGRGMVGRDNNNPQSNRERGAGVSEQPKKQLDPLPEAERKNVRNNHAERGVDYAPKGEDARIKANIDAIELAKRLLDAGETATPEQMEVLRKFSGWGGLGKAFNENTPTAKRLRELLGEDGYNDAVMSRNSAYYTPAPVIDAMWDVARALGFKGGNVLEGSAGIGNILGLMPTDMSDRSNIHAVEIDRTTGGILSLLYPDAQVDIQGFERTKVRNNSVDLAITNVPFVTGLHVKDDTGDKDLSKKFRNIHDFCIAKNIRKLREGGLGIFITSSGTMDNSKELRRWITNEGNADVIGAFRMHNKTFGGTGATSDIIVVRKRVNGKPSPNAIDVAEVTGVRVTDYDTGDTRKVKGEEIPIIKPYSMTYNKYFAEHPENMAGEMLFNFERGETRFPTSRALFPSADKPQEKMLSEWAARFSAMAERQADNADMQEEGPSTSVEEEATRINEKLGEGVKEGSMVLNSQGELCMARMGEAVPLGLNKNKVKGHTKAECFEDYTAIKKALSDVLEYQSANEDNAGLEPLLKELNRAFDTFTKKYGNLHKNPAISFLRNDVDFSSIMALETYSERGDKKGNKVVKVGKTDIFSRRVIETEKEPQPTTVKDGILASLYKSGGIDVDYISQALGKSADEVKQEIVKSGLGYENPSSGKMEVSYQYLSGNVREKLHIAQENNEDGRYDANIAALEKVIPMTIPAHLIEFALGSSWIEPKLYEDFVYDKTGIRVKLTNVGGTWFMKTPWSTFNEKNRSMAVTSKICDKTIMGHELIEAAITNRQITVSKQVKHYDGTTETISDKAATAECSTRIDEIRSEFKDWARERMHADAEMSARIEETYNEQFNNYVPMTIPDEFVPQHFGGQVTELHAKPFALRPHQGRAVVRGTTEPILLAHEVGTGKTYTLITTAMEMRRLGTARKPMIVVQNATVGQFVESAKEIYPNAKVLTIEEADRTAEGRKNFYAKIKYNDWDMIVVPQSVFERIPDSPEREMAYIQDIIEEKMKVLEAMREADDDGRSMIVRQAEKELEEQRDRLAELTEAIEGKKKKRDEKKEATTRQNAEVRAMEMLDREVDDVENFDDMGIDAILVDEAHEYKHLGFATAMQRGVKGVDPSFSKKSQGVYLKTQAVMERNHGRNVVFATGTPISNTAAEIWTFMRYLMPADQMKAYDIFYFDDFVRNFGNLAQMVEFKTNGKFAEVNRFAGYVNLPELVRIWSGVADTVLTREAGGVSDKIPEMEGGKPTDIYLPQTRALRSVMKYVKAELDRYDKMTGKEKKENSHIPLTMYGIAKAAAVDARLVIADAEDDPNSKTNATVRETLRSLNESAKYKGTVAIFSDNYQNKRSGFNLYEEIRNKLIAEGVPAEQIVVIKSGMTVKKKLDIFDKVNAGEIRVILGSTFTLGTGVNIQERLHTLIHVDAPNRPMDYTQRNGRAMRQGNLHKDMGIPVRIIRFGVEDSLDVTAYQRLKTKGAIADSIMNGSKMMQNSMENRVLEEEEDTFGDMTAQLSGSEYAILKNQAEREVRNLTAKQKGHDIDQIYVHNQLPKVEGLIKGAQRRIEIETKNLEIIGKHFFAGRNAEGDNPQGTIKKITIGKLSFDSVEGMEDFFKEQNAKMNEAAETIREGAENWTSRLEIRVYGFSDESERQGGLPFEVTTTVTREVDKSGQGTLSFEPERKVTYSCEALGIKDRTVKGNRIKNVMQEIAERIVTGVESRELLSRGQNQLAHYSEDYRQLQERNGREFPYKQQLAEAKERLAKYEEAMKKELEEKEAKYAEMDKGVDAASATDISIDDSDDDVNVEAKFRDGDSDGERLRAIRALEPIEVEPNNMSRAELREAYNRLRAVEKGGRVIEFYRSAFNKNYREGGLFGQVVPVLDDVLENSVLAYSETDNLGGMVRPDGTIHKEHPNVIAFDNYVGKASIDGIEYYVRLTVQRAKDTTTGLHSTFVSNVELYEQTVLNRTDPTINARPNQQNGFSSAESRTIPITSRGTTNFDRIVDAKLQQFFERASSEALELDKVDRVNDLSEKLGVPVKIISNKEDIDKFPSARHRRSKGWYNPETNEVVIVLPNNTDVADVDNTVVHEVVGHKGLRALIGSERFDDFLGEVYSHASNPIRKVIDKMTDDMVSAEADRLRVRKSVAHERAGEDVNSHYYADMAEARIEAERKREQFRREATEEYMSDLGGRIGSEGFEKMSRDELTLWGKIKAKVQQFLDKFLQGLKIAKSIRLRDKDLSYILYKSWKNLRREKGEGGVFADAEDAVMRRRTGWDAELDAKVKAEEATERTNDRFNTELQQQIDGTLPAGHIYMIGNPGSILKAAGFPDMPIELSAKQLAKKAVQRNHEFDLGDLKNLPKEIQTPIAVFRYGDKSKSENVIVGLNKDGKQFVVGVHFNQERRGTVVSDIRGLFPKDNAEWLNWISQGKAEWLDKEKIQTLIDQQRTNLAEVAYLDLDDVAKVINSFENPKYDEGAKIRFRDPDMGLDETITRMKADAMQAYLSNYDAGWENTRRLDITGVSKDEFKKWVQSSKRKTKPFAEYAGVKAVCPVCGKVDIPNYHSHDVVCPQCSTDLSVFRQINQLSEGEKQELSDKFKGEDNQGNPIDHVGNLIVEDVKSVDEITDDDFNNPTRTVGLPKLPGVVSEAIGANGKRVIIKKNIFGKNHNSHRDLTPADSREILHTALYTPSLYGQNQKQTRPYNWILIHLADKNTCVLLEVDNSKDDCEIVNWHYLGEAQLEQKKRQAEREGGRILTLSEENAVGDTSLGLSSTGKDNTFFANNQISEDQSALKGDNSAEKQADVEETPLTAEDMDDTIDVNDNARRARQSVNEARKASHKAVRKLSDKIWEKGSKEEIDLLEKENAEAMRAYNQKLDEYAEELLKSTDEEIEKFAEAVADKKEYYALMRDAGDFNLKEETRKKFETFATRLKEAVERQRSAKVYAEATDISNFEGKKPKKFNILEASADKSPNEAYVGVSHIAEDKVAVATNGSVLVVTEKDYDPTQAGKRVGDKGVEVGEASQIPYKRIINRKEQPVTWKSLKADDIARMNAALKSIPAKERRQATVVVAFGRGVYVTFNAGDWSTFLRAAAHVGASDITVYPGRVATATAREGAAAIIGIEPGEKATLRHDMTAGVKLHAGDRMSVERVQREVYEVTKGMIETTGIEVVEVGDAEVQAMLGNREGGDVQLMGSRTDKKMAAIGEHYADKVLDDNARTVVDVYAGKADNAAIEIERPEGKVRVVMRQGNENRAGAKHSLFRHYDAQSNSISAEDIARIPKIIATGEKTVDGNRIAYSYISSDGTRYRVTTELSGRQEKFTNFLSNKKPLQIGTRLPEGNTQLSAQASDAKVDEAKVDKKTEADKAGGEKPAADARFYCDTHGTVYGWTVGGKIFLNRDAINPETPLHEYTHLWDEMVRKENPELWRRGVELMKQTPVWREVMEDENYADIHGDEDAVASEVHSRLTGRDGARLMEEMIERGKREGVFKEAEACGLVAQLKMWLKDMFKSLKRTLSKWSKRELDDLTIEDFNRMTMRDLAEGINPRREIRRGDNTRIVTATNPMLDDYHRGVRSRDDVMLFDEVLAEAEKAWKEYGDLTYPDMDIDMLRQAKATGKITIYSSKPIEAGVFVTPSRMNAEDYAGGGRVYSKEVNVDDVAWTGEDEGQYAPTGYSEEGDVRLYAMSGDKVDFERASSEALELDKVDRVNDLSEKLGVPVKIISNKEDIDKFPSARHRRSKGWYNPETNEVVIVLPNNTDVADVDNTVVHEVVGHKGLRALIGSERFDDFLGEVYSHASNPIRKVIDKMTDDMVSAEADRLRVRKSVAHERAGEDVNSHYYADMAKARIEAEQKREQFRKEATEEYMSDLGGRIGSEGFEKMSRDELTFWGKIKAKVQQFLDKFLQGLKIAKSIRLNDKDLSYILYKSWKNLRREKGEGGVFADAEDAVMRRRTGWDDMMFVSEKYCRIQKLRKSVPVRISGNEIEYSQDLKVFKKNAIEYGKNLQGEYVNEDTGKTVQLQRGRRNGGLKEVLQHDLSEKAHIQSIAAIPEIIRKSVYIETRPNMDIEKNADVSSYEHYVCGLCIGDEDYTVHSIIASDKAGNRYYDHKLSHIEKGRLLDFIEAKQPKEQILTPMSGTEPTIRSQRKIKELISLLQVEDEGAKIRFRDPDMGLDETITRMKADAMRANTDNLQAKRDAMRAIGGNLNRLRSAMARQREYDISTAKSIKDLARIFMENGLLNNMAEFEVKSLLSATVNAVGRQDISKQVNRVFDINC